jgi:PAS domain S-box-containing protein
VSGPLPGMAAAYYRALFEWSADAVLVADEASRYLDVNQAASDLLGYPREELLSMHVRDVVVNGPDWMDAEYTRFVEEGSWRGELDLRRKDGTIVPVEARATKAALTDRVVFISTLRDITERRNFERMQQEFLAAITHELRNPLTPIIGFAQVMLRDGQYRQEAVESIYDNARRLDRIIGDLLVASRLEAGRLELQRAETDLAALLKAVVEQTEALTTRHRISLELPSAPMIGQWDRQRLEQVIHNLISNALKYSPDGGEVRVTASVENGEVAVSVSDQGIGIAPEAMSTLFQRFYRSPSARVSGAHGLGLGLYISRSLVEAHGGAIRAESKGPGKGSTFTFTLPVDRG